jgi:hypothetical protein
LDQEGGSVAAGIAEAGGDAVYVHLGDHRLATQVLEWGV